MGRTSKTKTTAAFSLKHNLVKRIAELAVEENRSKSNMADVLLERGIKAYEQERQGRVTL